MSVFLSSFALVTWQPPVLYVQWLVCLRSSSALSGLPRPPIAFTGVLVTPLCTPYFCPFFIFALVFLVVVDIHTSSTSTHVVVHATIPHPGPLLVLPPHFKILMKHHLMIKDPVFNHPLFYFTKGKVCGQRITETRASVKIKDHTINYRKLSLQTKFDYFPLPNVEEIFYEGSKLLDQIFYAQRLL